MSSKDFRKILKYQIPRKSVHWELICSVWTNMTSLFAILPTRLKINSHRLEPTSTNTTNFALARRFERKSCTLQLSGREGTWRTYLPQCWSKKFSGTGLSLESTFCLLLAPNHQARTSYIALANSALSMHWLERAFSAGLPANFTLHLLQIINCGVRL